MEGKTGLTGALVSAEVWHGVAFVCSNGTDIESVPDLPICSSLGVTRPQEFTRSEGPIMLDYYDSERNDELAVTFENCQFRGNRYFGMGAQTSLIVGTSDQNRIKISKTIFADNDMKWNTTAVCCDADLVFHSHAPRESLTRSTIKRSFPLVSLLNHVTPLPRKPQRTSSRAWVLPLSKTAVS